VGPRVTAKPTANFVGHGLTMDSGDIGRWPLSQVDSGVAGGSGVF
jgi:hypothetical protein